MQKDKPQLHRAFDWTIIAAMREEERQKALRLSSEAVKAARAKILADLKGSRDGDA